MDRKAYWYSVVRYSPDEISGEIINVGIILHSVQSEIVSRFYILDESSPKIKNILSSKIEESTYKSYKDIIEYYLVESNKSLTGLVGEIGISSIHNEHYLMALQEFFKDKKMYLSEPTFSLSRDTEGLFKSLFSSYVGLKYYPHGIDKEQNVKNLVRKVFEDKNFLNIKVKQDIAIEPLPNLPIKLNVDFGFKNGVWNYLQTTPSIKNTTKGTEWFAKTKFLIDSIKEEEAKVYLLYRKSVLHEKTETINLINYFGYSNERVVGMDMDDSRNVLILCDKIEKEAHLLETIC
ncbi:DUF3037 domain-containing protein [Paenibacillus macerans]|uniref:DUF3037 domain-containing protein n=1 Tax=Paenibacillus macerans TaxID=44252 RepID=UPI003D31F866